MIEKLKDNKELVIAIGLVAIALIAMFIRMSINKRPPEIDIKMVSRTEYEIDSIILNMKEVCDELGIDFDSVQSGANCFSGTQKNSYETEKYGIIYTEVSYCNEERIHVRIYNSAKDQKLRESDNTNLIHNNSNNI